MRRREGALAAGPRALPAVTGADARCQAAAIAAARLQSTRAAATAPRPSTKEPRVRWRTNDNAASGIARERASTSEKAITDVTAGIDLGRIERRLRR
jgi:hypothetical protein